MSSKKKEEKGKKEDAAPERKEKSEKSIKIDKDAKNDSKSGKDDPKKKAASKSKDDDSEDERTTRGKGGKGSVDNKTPGKKNDSDDDDNKNKKGAKANAKEDTKKKPAAGKGKGASDDDQDHDPKGKGKAGAAKADKNRKSTINDDDSDNDKGKRGASKSDKNKKGAAKDDDSDDDRGAGKKKVDPKKNSVAGGKGRKGSDDDDDEIEALRKGVKKKTVDGGKNKGKHDDDDDSDDNKGTGKKKLDPKKNSVAGGKGRKGSDDDDDEIEALRKGVKKKTIEGGKKKGKRDDDDDDDDDDDKRRKSKKAGGEERRKTKTRKSLGDDDEDEEDEEDEFKTKNYRKEGDDDEMYIKVVYHQHRLRNSGMEKVKWMCEGVKLNPDKKCYRSHKEEPSYHDHERYQCANGCKINICDECAVYFKEYPEKPAVKIPEHPHPLYYRPADNGKWSCDIIDIKGGVCEHKHKKEEVERDHPYYKCLSGCNFRVCDLCAETKGSSGNKPSDKDEELARVVFHPHKFKNTGIDRSNKWFCEGIYLTPNKNCLRFHKKDPRLWDHPRWQCTGSAECSISLCDLCVDKFMDYEVPPIKADHRHLLYYRPADMTKWYCDTLASEKGICESKHKRELVAHPHPYYRCLEGCEFLLCDLCAKKFVKEKEKNEFLSPKTTKLDEKTMKHLQQSEEFEIYLEKTGISSAFTIIFGEILTKKIKADSVYGYAAMRLRQMGTDIAVAYSQYQREMAQKDKEKLKGRKSTAAKDSGDRKGRGGKDDGKGSVGKKGKAADPISDDDDDDDDDDHRSNNKKGGKGRESSKDHKKSEKETKAEKHNKDNDRKSADPKGKAEAGNRGEPAREKSVKIDPKAKK